MTEPLTPPPAGDLTPSLVRTLVPVLIAGPLTAWAIKRGFSIDQGEASAILTPLCTAGYYFLVRLLERHAPGFGWLLGLAKQPAYSPLPAPPAQPAPEVDEPPAPNRSISHALGGPGGMPVHVTLAAPIVQIDPSVIVAAVAAAQPRAKVESRRRVAAGINAYLAEHFREDDEPEIAPVIPAAAETPVLEG